MILRGVRFHAMRRFLPGLAALALFAAAPSPVFACAIMPRPERVVRVSGEEVLIIWDAVAQREHLIRYIGFRGDVDDFGFLVPTPSPPEVAEVQGNPFQRVFDIYFRRAPRRRARRCVR